MFLTLSALGRRQVGGFCDFPRILHSESLPFFSDNRAPPSPFSPIFIRSPVNPDVALSLSSLVLVGALAHVFYVSP